MVAGALAGALQNFVTRACLGTISGYGGFMTKELPLGTRGLLFRRYYKLTLRKLTGSTFKLVCLPSNSSNIMTRCPPSDI